MNSLTHLIYLAQDWVDAEKYALQVEKEVSKILGTEVADKSIKSAEMDREKKEAEFKAAATGLDIRGTNLNLETLAELAEKIHDNIEKLAKNALYEGIELGDERAKGATISTTGKEFRDRKHQAIAALQEVENALSRPMRASQGIGPAGKA